MKEEQYWEKAAREKKEKKELKKLFPFLDNIVNKYLK